MTYTPKEIAEFYGIKYSEINKGIKNLRKLIDTKQIMTSYNIPPNQFIKRYCNKLKMLNIHSDEAVRISNNVEKLNIATEHNPYSLAAASILFVAEIYKLKYINKKKLASEFDISDVTISKTYKKIESHKDIILDDEKVKQIQQEIETQYCISNDDIPEDIKQEMQKYGILFDTQSKNVIKHNTSDEYDSNSKDENEDDEDDENEDDENEDDENEDDENEDDENEDDENEDDENEDDENEDDENEDEDNKDKNVDEDDIEKEYMKVLELEKKMKKKELFIERALIL
jgi:hypothetical protein